MIEIQHFSKSYQSVKALDDISLTVPRSEVIGLLEPNGAGKTTLLKLIAGILQPDAGVIRPSRDAHMQSTDEFTRQRKSWWGAYG